MPPGNDDRANVAAALGGLLLALSIAGEPVRGYPAAALRAR
jgi:hypothetical protein